MPMASSASIVSPDCRDGNCGKCPGDAMDLQADEIVACQHECHRPNFSLAMEKDDMVQVVYVRADGFGAARKAAKEFLPGWTPFSITELDEGGTP